MVLNTSGEPDAPITSSGDIVLDPRAVDGAAIVSATFLEAVLPLPASIDHALQSVHHEGLISAFLLTDLFPL